MNAGNGLAGVTVALTLIVVIIAYRTMRVGVEAARLSRESTAILRQPVEALRHLRDVARQEASVAQAQRDLDVANRAMGALGDLVRCLPDPEVTRRQLEPDARSKATYAMVGQRFRDLVRQLDPDEVDPRVLPTCWQFANAPPQSASQGMDARQELGDVIHAHQKVLADRETELAALVARRAARGSSGPE